MRHTQRIFKNLVKRHHAQVRENIRAITDMRKKAKIKSSSKDKK
jgi:hypothetical protein